MGSQKSWTWLSGWRKCSTFQSTEEGTCLSVSLQHGDLVTLITSLLLKTLGCLQSFSEQSGGNPAEATSHLTQKQPLWCSSSGCLSKGLTSLPGLCSSLLPGPSEWRISSPSGSTMPHVTYRQLWERNWDCSLLVGCEPRKGRDGTWVSASSYTHGPWPTSGQQWIITDWKRWQPSSGVPHTPCFFLPHWASQESAPVSLLAPSGWSQTQQRLNCLHKQNLLLVTF